jgi:hypothetical protein
MVIGCCLLLGFTLTNNQLPLTINNQQKKMNPDFLAKLRSLFSITLFIVLVAFIGFSSWQLIATVVAKFS